MTPKGKFLILYNTIALLPVIIYLIFWFFVSLYAAFSSLILFVMVASVLLLVSTIMTALRLKLAILKDVGDPGLAPVKRIYKSASRINIGGYVLFYPMMFGVFGVLPIGIGVIFIIATVILAIPLRIKISRRKSQYERVKKSLYLGKMNCARCKTTLSYLRRYRMWVCYRCGARWPV
jgi:hypothetical protein